MRKAISPHERLSATLRFLATGRSYRDLELTTIMFKQILSEIIPETCRAIYNRLFVGRCIYLFVFFDQGLVCLTLLTPVTIVLNFHVPQARKTAI
jgi:hypothetical protein